MAATAHLLSFPVDFRISRTRIVYSHHIVIQVGSGSQVGAGSGVLYRTTGWTIKRHWDRWLRAALSGMSNDPRPETWSPLLGRLIEIDPGLSFAVDSALWDLHGKLAQQPVAFLIDAIHRQRIPITEQIFVDDWAKSEQELQAIRGRGTRHLKVKTGFSPQGDRTLIERVRAAFGSDVEIRIDANRAYPLARSLDLYRNLAQMGVLAAEEPISDRSWEALRRFRDQTKLPVMLDESILSLRDLQNAIQARSLDVLNIKLTRVGGISCALEYIRMCRQGGIDVSIGCSEDIGPGMASILHLSAAVDPLYSTEGMGNLRLGTDIISEPMPITGGTVDLPSGYGLGVSLLPDFADHVASRARVLDFTRARPAHVYLYSRYLRWRQRAATAFHRLNRNMARKDRQQPSGSEA